MHYMTIDYANEVSKLCNWGITGITDAILKALIHDLITENVSWELKHP